MTTTPFATPSETTSEDRFAVAEHEGRTVLFAGITRDVFNGEYGQQEIAKVDVVVVLDHPDGPQAFADAMVFGKALAPTLYRSPQPVMLGVIGKGEAKPGRQAPWILKDPDEATAEAARNWWGKGFVSEKNGRYVYSADEAPF